MHFPSYLTAITLYFTAALGVALPNDINNNKVGSLLAERATKPPVNTICGGQWGNNPNFPTLISSEIDTWKKETPAGQICLGAGPGICKRLWCNNGIRFGFCNDDGNKCVDKKDIAARLRITQACTASAGFGQTFYPDHTNVLITSC